MDPANVERVDQCYRLLALCARAEPHPLMDELLTRYVAGFSAWDELPAQAELHGMAPLLRHHLKRAGLSIPDGTRRLLDGLYLRHREVNQAHAQVLLDISELFESSGIAPVVLKGLALAYEVYPDPALRPTSDIDLLLKTEEMLPALDLLKEAGFHAEAPPAAQKPLPKELTAVAPAKDGITTRVELHHHDPRNTSVVDRSLDDEFSGFSGPPRRITVGQGSISVPERLDTVNYLFKHLRRHMFVATASNPLPLRWIADILSFVEIHVKTLDWAVLFENDPALRNRLEVLYSLTPFPEHLAEFIPLQRIQPPAGINQYPRGWPQQVFPEWKQKGFWYYTKRTLVSPGYIRDTLSCPSPWWLRLQYGIDDGSVFWYGQVIYRLQVLRMAIAKFF